MRPPKGDFRFHVPVEPSRRDPRGHFARRIGILILLAIFATFIHGAVSAQLLLGREIDRHDEGGPPPQALLLLIPIGFGFFSLVRGLRRTAAPIGVLMAAADRDANWDYSFQLNPQGSADVWRLMNSFNAMTSRLQSNEEQRQMLLSDIAHELRNPLAIIRGNVEGMIDGVYSRDDDHLNLLLEETSHMTHLLEDLQTLSMADAGMLRVHPEPVDLRPFLLEIVMTLRLGADTAGISLTLGDVPNVEITVDPVRIRQVLENLIANSVRHTASGGSVQMRALINRFGAQIEVTDNGKGIPLPDLPYIFDRFTKSADSGGSGLGLAIARRLVEAHGGTIGAESSVGIGTTIRINLPSTPE